MNDTIEPLEIDLPEAITHYTMMQISVKNSFAFCSDDGVFKQATIDEKGKAFIKVLSPGFPARSGECESDDSSDIIWLRYGRGVYFYDMRSKIKCRALSSADGDSELGRVMVADPEKKLVIMEVCEIGDDFYYSNGYYIQHDIKKNKEILQKDIMGIGLYRLDQDKLLFAEFSKELKRFNWAITDTTFETRSYNKLTQILSENRYRGKAIDSKLFDAKGRIMLGEMPNPVKSGYRIPVMIRWNEDYEDVSLTPLIAQQPGGRPLDIFWRLNQGGSWAKTMDCDIPGYPPQLLFTHIGNYPGGMSLPVKGGYTHEIIKGVWIDHETWGPCYVEMKPKNNSGLLLYKMTDALQLLPGIMIRAATSK